MASNRNLRVGPVALTTTTTTNILNPAAAGSGTGYTPTATYILIRHIRVTNKTNTAAFVALWIGATGANAAGTEFAFGGAATAGALNANTGVSVAANSFQDWYGSTRLDAADFLVGGAGTATALTITIDAEEGLA